MTLHPPRNQSLQGSRGDPDVAAGLNPDRRDPPGLAPTGINGTGRADRFYATPELWESGAIQAYVQHDSGGSDHHMIMIVLKQDQLARAQAPGFRP